MFKQILKKCLFWMLIFKLGLVIVRRAHQRYIQEIMWSQSFIKNKIKRLGGVLWSLIK